MVLSIALLAACADEGGPSFAPDAATETAVSALTPPPTATIAVLDRQPGERDDPERSIVDLAQARGGTATLFIREGGVVTLFDAATGDARPIRLPNPETIVGVAVSSAGTTAVVLRRSGSRLSLDHIDAAGDSLGTLEMAAAVPGTPDVPGTPPAGTPVTGAPSVTRDRIEISPDGRHVVVISREGDLSIVATEAELSVVRVVEDFGDVSALGWTSDGSLALVATYDESRSSGSLTGVPLDGRLRSIVRLPAGDARRIVFAASPNLSEDVFYVARSASEDWTAQNNLYRIPLVGGTPSVVLATGLAGPAGAVDRFAVSADGRVAAAAVLVPRGGDLVFHSLWVTDTESPEPIRVQTGTLGLVSRLAWTVDGLFVVGVQRERDTDASRLATVSLRLGGEGTLVELGRTETAATPAASPVASPVPATPAATPVE